MYLLVLLAPGVGMGGGVGETPPVVILRRHSPADVLAQVFMDLGVGTDPADGDDWPVYVGTTPEKPDNVVTVYDSEGGRLDGRLMTSGEQAEHPSVEVRVRGRNHTVAYQAAQTVARFLDTGVYLRWATLDGSEYLVQSVSRTTDPVALGKDAPNSKRNSFSIQALMALSGEPYELDNVEYTETPDRIELE